MTAHRLVEYLFVIDHRDGTFPERWRVLRDGEPDEVPDVTELSGTVHETETAKMRRRFAAEYPAPRFDIAAARATSWSAVRTDYRGLRDHDHRPIESGGATAAAGAGSPAHPPVRDAAPGSRRRESSRRPGKWTRLLLGIYLTTSVLGAAAVSLALAALPPQAPGLASGEEQDVQLEAERIRQWVAAEHSSITEWLAPMGLFNVDDGLRSLLTPNDWERDNVSLDERVARLNRSLERIRKDSVNAVFLLSVIFMGGFLCAFLAWLRPNLGTAVATCIFPLLATPIATEPLIGVDNMNLFYPTLPMLITGGTFLLIEAARGAGRTVAGPRSEAWARVWMGLAMIAAGAVATAVGIALSVAANAGIIAVAAGPVLYGIFSVLWGFAGLLKRRNRR